MLINEDTSTWHYDMPANASSKKRFKSQSAYQILPNGAISIEFQKKKIFIDNIVGKFLEFSWFSQKVINQYNIGNRNEKKCEFDSVEIDDESQEST